MLPSKENHWHSLTLIFICYTIYILYMDIYTCNARLLIFSYSKGQEEWASIRFSKKLLKWQKVKSKKAITDSTVSLMVVHGQIVFTVIITKLYILLHITSTSCHIGGDSEVEHMKYRGYTCTCKTLHNIIVN